MKYIIEEKSGIKIRKGYEKLIFKTLEYFQIKICDIKEEESIKIVNFINSSNSKLSDSYWVLRADKKYEEYCGLMNQYRNNFFESSYKNTSRRNITRKFRKKYNSMGYTGYTTIGDNRFYCRSKNEFIYIHYLHELYKDKIYKIEYEDKIFYINDISYKPDYFLYENNILVKIFEVKHQYKQVDFEDFISFFKDIGIEFVVLNSSNHILKRYPNIREKMNHWINEIATIENDNRGVNNPRYGVKCSDETKKIISEKAKDRFKDEEYLKKISNGVKESYILNPELTKGISERQKKRYENNHFKKCVYCGETFYIENLRGYKKKYCDSIRCKEMNHEKIRMNMLNNYINNIKKYSKMIIRDNFDMKYSEFLQISKEFKNKGFIPKKFSLNISTIDKYFGSFEKMIEII